MQYVVRFLVIIEIIWQFKYLLAVKFNDMKQLTACDVRGALWLLFISLSWNGRGLVRSE